MTAKNSPVQHYWLEVDAMTKTMQIREEQAEYRPNDNASETRT